MLRILELVISWPLVVIVVALTLRKPIGRLIDRIDSAEGPGGVKIQTALDRAESSVDLAITSVRLRETAERATERPQETPATPEQPAQQPAPRVDPRDRYLTDELMTIADQWVRDLSQMPDVDEESPNQSILRTWEWSLRHLFKLLPYGQHHSAHPPSPKLLEPYLHQLTQDYILPVEWVRSWNSLRTVAGGARRGESIGPLEADRFRNTTRELMMTVPPQSVLLWTAQYEERRAATKRADEKP